MAATWKKVLTEASTVEVPNGGTGLTSLEDGAVLIGAGTDAVEHVVLNDDQILMGHTNGSTGTNPVAVSVGVDTDAQITCDDSAYYITILDDAVEGSMVKDNDLEWTTHENTVVGNALKVPYYAKDTGVPTLSAAATTSGQVLQYDGSSIVWGSNTATDLAIDDESTENKIYNIGFGETNADGTLGEVSGNTDFNVSSNFTINPQPSSGRTIVRLRVDATSSVDDDINGIIMQADSVEATNIIRCSNFYGTSTAAKRIENNAASASQTYNLLFSETAATNDANAAGHKAVTHNSVATYSVDDSGNGTLTVPNLTVTGTTTTVNTTELTIEDASVRIADGTVESTDNTVVGTGEVGIIVGYKDNDDANMPRVVYKGYQDTVSVLGWRIARAANNDADSATTSYGVGVMHIDDGTMSISGGDDSINIGVGALATDANGDLWLQTAV